MKWLTIALVVTLAGCISTAPDAPTRPMEETPDELQAASPPWAAPEAAAVAPGREGHALIDGRGISFTMAFLFATPDNATIYVSTVAHAMHLGGIEIPLGHNVTLPDGTVFGHFVYDGWERGEVPEEDFALIELNEVGRAMANPQLLDWGGPTGIAPADAQVPGSRIFSYGERNGGTNEGRIVDEDETGLVLRMDRAMAPGDSGSPVLTWDGQALGLLARIFSEDQFGVAAGDEVEKAGLGISLEHNLGVAAEAGFDVELVTAPYEGPDLPL